jgi:predicted RNase H-like HicB family nuclease
LFFNGKVRLIQNRWPEISDSCLDQTGGCAIGLRIVEEITLQIQRDEESGWLVASWDAPDGAGGITTQGQDLRDLQQQLTEAVAACFEEHAAPRRIRFHFVSDPVLVQA